MPLVHLTEGIDYFLKYLFEIQRDPSRTGTVCFLAFIWLAGVSPSAEGWFMFRCEECGKVVPAGVSAVKVVISERVKEYLERTATNPRGRGMRATRTIDRGGVGREIVSEKMMCPECAAMFYAAKEKEESATT